MGRSLGVDLVSGDKTCTFDCIYCQLGSTIKHLTKRDIFVPTAEIVKEIESLPSLEIDYITLSGTAEPTLAANLGEVILEIKKRFNKPVAVLTNSSLMHDPQVRKELSLADKVVAKLDAPNEEIFRKINRPAQGITFDMIVDGIIEFNREYPGKLALQVMFMYANIDQAETIAKLAKEIGPIEVEVNTPLRPCAVRPLPPEELQPVKRFLEPLKVYSVYDVKRPAVQPLDLKKTKMRRPEGG